MKRFLREAGKRAISLMVAVALTWGLCPLLPQVEAATNCTTRYFEEISRYRTAGNYIPPELTGYVFAGWYSDASCKKALGTDVTVGKAYAKFVDADVLTVKAQITEGTTQGSDKADIRFVTTVDSLQYRNVGFQITIEGREPKLVEARSIYERLYAVGNNSKVDDLVPSAKFSTESKYFCTYTYRKVPNSHFNTKFTVTPYWTTHDGTRVCGATVDKTVNMGVSISSYQNSIVTANISSSVRDPYVLRYNGHYYIYYTGWHVYKSREDSLTGEFDYVGNGPCVEFPADYESEEWAPEVYPYNGKFYMFATYKSNKTHYRGCAVFSADAPEGPFKMISNGHITPGDGHYIDGTLYIDENNQPWMVYSKDRESVSDRVGEMYCVKLNSELTAFASEPVMLFRANQAKWAVSKDGYLTDGPFLYRTQKGSLIMLWSSWDEYGYCVGIAKSESGSIMGPWIQQDEPLYSKKYTGTYDGGHGMVFTDADGKMWLAIHSPNDISPEKGKEDVVFIPVKEENDTLVWNRQWTY